MIDSHRLFLLYFSAAIFVTLATTTRRRIEDYLEERQIHRLTDDFDFEDDHRPKKKKGAK